MAEKNASLGNIGNELLGLNSDCHPFLLLYVFKQDDVNQKQ